MAAAFPRRRCTSRSIQSPVTRFWRCIRGICDRMNAGLAMLAAVPGVGAKLASVTLRQCRDAAEAVLATANPAAARAAAIEILG